jgi:P4 family phage/plasmid primase-like protien
VTGAASEPTPTFWAASDLAKAGYPVFPLKDKEPSVVGGFYACTKDVSQIAEWITEGRAHHDVAVATGLVSGVVVLDADTPEAFEEMRSEYGEPDVLTRRGGHWWFSHPRNGKVTSTKVRDGLDRKGDGGYVAVPPSRGRTWTNGIPDRSSLPFLPREFWPKRAERSDAARSLPAELKDRAAETIARYVAKIPPGGDKGRHEHLQHLCGVLLARGVAFGDAEDVLCAAWARVGGELADRASREVPNTLRTTEQALTEGRATGVPSLEAITPGLYGELEAIFGWKVRITFGVREPAGEVLHFPSNGHGSPNRPARFNLTDLGNTGRLIARHGQDLRYCFPWSRWLIWDGRRFIADETGAVHRRAKETVKGIYQEAAAAPDEEQRKALAKHAMRSEAENRIQAMISLAKSEVPTMPAELDASRWLLNCANGTVDLRTGELREHRREDRLTKLAPTAYDPKASAPTWAATLERVLPSEAVRTFFKRLCGYAISGDVSEHVLPVLYGTGANGKSTIVNALLEAAGEYGMQAAPDLLIAKRGGHPTEVADLFGMRLVASVETEDGRRFAESLVKQLTGGDKVRARRMRQDFWEFDPTHTVFLATNHKPEVRGTDTAIWRRIRLIPFTETIPPEQQDKKLPEKLRSELPGILAWCVEGCLEWQREGLQAPDEVRKATGEYRSEMDVIGAFLRDECEVGRDYKASFADVYERYEEWCEEGGEKPETRRKFNARLKERGRFDDRRSGPGGSYEWHGLRLLKKRNTGFAGKLKNRSANDYNGCVSTSRSSNGQNNFSSSVTSVKPAREPLSAGLDPGQSATLEELRNRRSEGPEAAGDVANAAREIGRAGSGPAKMLAAYLEKPNRERLMYLARAVLTARGEDPAGWEALASAVEAAATNPDNHPIGCECEGCL